MTESRSADLIGSYEVNHWLIHQHTDGISQDESMLQPPFDANCMNWVVGHIVGRRDSGLRAIGGSLIADRGYFMTYGTESPPLRDPASATNLFELIALLDRSQTELTRLLTEVGEERLDLVVENDRGSKPAFEHLRGFHWHETYHLGQLELLKAFIHSQR